MRLYLVIFAISFFLYSLYKPVSLYDFDRIIKTETSGLLAKKLEQKAKRLNTTAEELSDRVSRRWAGNVSLLQLVYVFLLAGVLKLVYLPVKKVYVEHLIFCFHYFAFNFFVAACLWPLYYWMGAIDPFGRTAWIALLGFVANSIYLFFALKRVYQDRIGVTLYRTLLVWLGGQICFVFVVVSALLLAIVQVMA